MVNCNRVSRDNDYFRSWKSLNIKGANGMKNQDYGHRIRKKSISLAVYAGLLCRPRSKHSRRYAYHRARFKRLVI